MCTTHERAAPATPNKGAASETAPATGFRKNKEGVRDSPGNRVPLEQSPAANGNCRQYCRAVPIIINITLQYSWFCFCFISLVSKF